MARAPRVRACVWRVSAAPARSMCPTTAVPCRRRHECRARRRCGSRPPVQRSGQEAERRGRTRVRGEPDASVGAARRGPKQGRRHRAAPHHGILTPRFLRGAGDGTGRRRSRSVPLGPPLDFAASACGRGGRWVACGEGLRLCSAEGRRGERTEARGRGARRWRLGPPSGEPARSRGGRERRRLWTDATEAVSVTELGTRTANNARAARSENR